MRHLVLSPLGWINFCPVELVGGAGGVVPTGTALQLCPTALPHCDITVRCGMTKVSDDDGSARQATGNREVMTHKLGCRTSSVQADISACDGDVQVIGVVPLLIRQALRRRGKMSEREDAVVSTKWCDLQGNKSRAWQDHRQSGLGYGHQKVVKWTCLSRCQAVIDWGLTAPGVQTKVGPGQPDNLVVPLGDFEPGSRRAAGDVGQQSPVCERGTDRDAETQCDGIIWVDLEGRGSFDERGSRSERGEDGNEGDSG